ncbi:RNA polymerase sigma-70 factor [Bacteroides sp. ET489]|jgi:RNA polymerase sigma-70 factor (ECF subfamily)|uniref:RNA polymerase sigma-70 factor n=1 Tax=Bacteroides TaxID=816 RepID=UPI0023F863BB|nr:MULTISPECIES: RNA polymerase sigma-70 factor [Bacteroides]MDO3390401.1 RNA polymerase sigma-70 factor [Bacteroides sp. ET489]
MYAIETLKDERTLVLRLIDGDEEAFCELYAAYKNRLIYFAMRFLKSRDYAEDVFQDAFTVIWQGRRFINPDTSFSSYLYTIVRNRILNQLRNLEKEENLRDYILSQAVDYSDDTRQHILANDLRNLISSAMHQLTDRQREIFEMSREEQMSHREIAEALGISVNTVQEHISSSLRILRSYLKKYVVTYADLVLLLICLRF